MLHVCLVMEQVARDRGLGLYNVMKVIDRYPNASISTNSEQHTFRQGLEIIF